MEVDGVKLRELREERSYSLRELAEMSGVNYRTIHRLEQEKTGAQPRTIRKLAAALGVDPRALRPQKDG